MVKEEKSEEELSKKLFRLAMQKKWKEVADIYSENREAHEMMLTKSEETALHIAISSCHNRNPNDANYIDKMIVPMEKMIDQMNKEKTLTKVLTMKNVRKDTPLHLAAALDSERLCRPLALASKESLVLRNLSGETPLFVAARHGNRRAFKCLHDQYMENSPAAPLEPLRRKDGDTVLHAAISGEYFKLAYSIITSHSRLVDSVNVDGESPLHILGRKPNVFKSSSHFHFYESIVYHCVFVDKLKVLQKNDYKDRQPRDSSESERYFPGNYRTCVGIILHLWKLINIITATAGFRSCTNKADEENQRVRTQEKRAGKSLPTQEKANGARTENDSATEKDEGSHGGFFPPNYITCIQLFKFAMKVSLTILGVGIGRIKKIKDKKERHCHALEIMNKMIGHEKRYEYDSNGQRPDINLKQFSGIDIPDMPPIDPQQITQAEAPTKSENKSEQKAAVKNETPLLVAVKMGIREMVENIIKTFPVAVQDLDPNGKNVVMLAAEYRQTSVFDYLLDQNLPEYMFHQLDTKENSILHLAAKLEDSQPWRIPGAALQMQWEIKWYQHVKESVSSMSRTHPNKKGETPRMVLTRTHKNLMQAGNEWLIKTSESCSVVAALIAAVAFATSSTVPGGLDQTKGYPLLRDKRAFDVFSIASLVALCLSITALVFFLAIITSRCEERDFKRNLPRKLLMGLTSLFSAIAAMLLSFCAGHTFILREKLRLAAVPIYTFATIPVAFFAIAQLPLYFDLVWATCRKVPLRSYKVFYK